MVESAGSHGRSVRVRHAAQARRAGERAAAELLRACAERDKAAIADADADAAVDRRVGDRLRRAAQVHRRAAKLHEEAARLQELHRDHEFEHLRHR
jgi:hypothetical protein